MRFSEHFTYVNDLSFTPLHGEKMALSPLSNAGNEGTCVSYLNVLGVNLHEVLKYLRKISGSLKLGDLVKHMQETCGLARNSEPLIPRALLIILLLALSV